MPGASEGNRLADRRHITAILRLLVDRHGDLVDGELVDAEARSRGHFLEWQELTRMLRDWLRAPGG
jgi:hypothetical protein